MEKQTFTIPEGCKAITVEQVGNQIVTTFEPEFKRGDVLYFDDDISTWLLIFKEKIDYDLNPIKTYVIFNEKSIISYNKSCRMSDDVARLATPEEAQRLWDALGKQGKRWNPETMQVEPIRWRAKVGEDYYSFWDMNILASTESGYATHNMRYNSGNYFRTEEQAERAKPYIQKALDDFWKEELK